MESKYEIRLVYEELNREIGDLQSKRFRDTSISLPVSFTSLVFAGLAFLTALNEQLTDYIGDLAVGFSVVFFIAIVGVAYYLCRDWAYKYVHEKGSVSKLIIIRDALAYYLAKKKLPDICGTVSNFK